MDPTVKLIKLVSGDNIIALTELETEDLSQYQTVVLYDPVSVNAFRFPKNGIVFETFVLQPWIALASGKEVIIETRHILIATNVKDDVVRQYFDYLSKDHTAQLPPDEAEMEEMDDEEMDEVLDMLNDETEEEYYGGQDREKPTYH